MAADDTTMNLPPPGVICSLEEYQRSLNDPFIHCLTRAESIGLTIGTEAGILSLIAISYVLFLVLRNVIWRCRHVKKGKLQIFHQPMDLLMFSLFFADTLQAVGGAINIKWINDGKIEVGSFCKVQGIIQSLGQSGVAITTLTMTIYTFVGMWMLKDISSKKATLVVLFIIWSFISLVVIVGFIAHNDPSQESFRVPTPYWCWISKKPVEWRFFGLYVWIYLSLLSSVLIYFPLCLLMRGNIVIDDEKWWKFKVQRADNGDSQVSQRRRRAFTMLAYPLAYSIIFLPLSIVRWISFVNNRYDPSMSIMFVSTSLFGLSGLVNVVLLLMTKPESGLFGHLMFKQPAQPLLLTPESRTPHDPERASHRNEAEPSESLEPMITVSPPSPIATFDLRCRDCGKKVETTFMRERR